MKALGFVAILASAFVGLATPSIAPARPHTAQQTQNVCGADYYVNVAGRCIHRPVQASRAPAGATARCRDGTYSFSQHRRGTCSYHGGVAEWL
jgi:type IV secretory pathway VirB6-like protein